ncbi:MAG: DUF4331 domain-containing protein [Myxococcales bacterium]
MKTIRNPLLRGLSLAVLAGALALPGVAKASSHREAPAIAYDPAADNTDVYAWVNKGTHDKLNIVANWIPFEEPSSGPNFFKFSDDVQYKIHLTRGSTSLNDVVTYTIRFKTQPIPRTDPATAPDGLAGVGGGKEFFAQLTGDTKTTGGSIVQTYTVTKTTYGANAASVDIVTGAIAAPWRIGPNTQKTLAALAPTLISSPTYDDAYAATFIKTGTDGTRVFAGPRDDGFYVDLGGIFDLANLRAKGTAQDGLAGYNVHSIALEIPTTQLTADGKAPAANTASDANTLGVWASSSRKKISISRANGTTSAYGPWVQVSRLGLPLINEAVIGTQDKDKYNRTTPSTDVANFAAYFLNPVIVRDAEAVGIYKALGVDPTPFRHNRTDILDVINLKFACGAGQTPPCHTVAIAPGVTGDVLRVDLGLDSGFPNGRSIPGASGTNAAKQEQADVTDVELTLLLAGVPSLSKAGGNGSPPFIQDGVDYNDKPFLTAFPWLALPWDGFAEGHGKTTP